MERKRRGDRRARRYNGRSYNKYRQAYIGVKEIGEYSSPMGIERAARQELVTL